MKCSPIEIRIPTDTAYLPVPLGAAEACGRLAGFKEPELGQIQLALEEAAVNAIRHGFEPDEPGELLLVFRITATGLEIALREQGRPFDPLALPTYRPEELAAHPDQRGLGTFLMGRMMDEVQFRNLGRHGMETLLRKHRPSDLDFLPEIALEPSPEPAAPAENPGTVSVHAMEPGEAEAVSRCAWDAYRYTYINEHIYDPAKVRALNASGELRSWVAMTEGGIVFGHAGTLRSERQPSTAEVGVAFVAPRFRGGGTLGLLIETMVTAARSRGLPGLFAHAVTTHPYSQKALQKIGFRGTAILLSATVPLSFKGIRDGAGSRESLLHSFLPLMQRHAFPIAAPTRHRPILARICQEQGIVPEFLEEVALPPGESLIDLSRDSYRSAHIVVRRIASDAPERLRKAHRALCLERVETIYTYLPLGDAATAQLALELEAIGGFLAGLMPSAPGEDLLVLQYLNNRVVDYGELQLASELGRELAAHVRSCDPSQSH